MIQISESFQIFVKPVGPRCNLGCSYCYYLEHQMAYPSPSTLLMDDDVLESYIRQHIEASSDEVVFFSWHGGEPTLAGLEYFRKVVALQRNYLPDGRQVLNGIQTNGTLLDDAWGHFLRQEHFVVGLSLDGPREFHDLYRHTRNGKSVFDAVMKGYTLLKKYQIPHEILCVVHAGNVEHPLEVYRFIRDSGASYSTFLPLVRRLSVPTVSTVPTVPAHLSDSVLSPDSGSVPAEAWGRFLCAIFDEWLARDIGKVKVQIFEEALRTAFGQEHSLCVFRPVCGRVPVVELNGDFYSCDHYVDEQHRLGNIMERSLADMLESPEQRAFGLEKFDSLPGYCRKCEVVEMCNGACPKDRFLTTPDGEPGLNYLCAGYKMFFLHCQPFVREVARVRGSEGTV